MEEGEAPRYWCHMCSQTVNPILEIESIKCPICQSGFVEEMESSATQNDTALDLDLGGSDQDRALSFWAPIVLGMMGNSRRRRRLRRMEFDDSENDNDGEADLDREIESLARRRRSSAAILQLLQGMRSGILSEPGNSDSDHRSSDNDSERVILINPFNQTVIVQGSYDPTNDSISRAPVGSLGDYFVGPGLDLLLQHLSENDPNRYGTPPAQREAVEDSISRAPVGSLGDYFVGPRLDLLLQHLSENDPNRYGTPPAQREAVEALPSVRIKENLQCSVCLDDCEIGDEVKEMPCKHKFHSKCILPWLELHSSCPVCRHQLPCDESKLDSEGVRSNVGESNNGGTAAADGDERGRQFSVSLPWPFSSLFSSSNSQSSGGNSNVNPSTSGQDES